MSEVLYNLKSIPIKIFIGQIPKIWSEDETRSFFQNFGIVLET